MNGTASLGHCDFILCDGLYVQEGQRGAARAGPAPFVRVARTQAMEDARSGLPILGMEQEIMEAISNNDVILLCGETGSGKTTQVQSGFPDFICNLHGVL